MAQQYTEPSPLSRLRLARNRARMSQVELAVRAGLDPATVVRAEKPGSEPSLTTQRKLALALDVDPDALWPLPDHGEAPEPERAA